MQELISKNKAIELISCCYPTRPSSAIGGWVWDKKYGACLTAEDAIRTTEPIKQWISTRDSLPEVGRRVIISMSGTVYPDARLTDSGWEYLEERSWDYWRDIYGEPEAWMPAIEPYTEESDE